MQYVIEERQTKDGSSTLFHQKYGETLHSITGAVEEARKKFVEPCNIAELAKNKRLLILDVCFGVGYNSAAALETIRKINPECRVRIAALEKDISVISRINLLNPPIESYHSILEKVNLHIGDARETIKKLMEKFDAVFFDPFSPKSCPELWTAEFLKDVKKRMNKGAILATYSCARIVRENLGKAGFEVKDGPCVGRRGPSTLAFF